MTKDKAWLDVLLVVQEDEFFSRSKSGAIWGTVYFQVGENQFFPGQGWTDLVAAFVGVWVEGLLRVAEGISKKERVAFFDGPFAVDVSMPQKGFLSLNFVRDEKPVLSKTVDIMHLLAHGHSVARELLSLCQHRQWRDRDTETLARIVEQMRYSRVGDRGSAGPMENGIGLKVIWLDEVEDLLEVVFSCSNGFFSGQAEIYVSCDDLSEFADALAGFPSRRDDLRDFELGTFDPDHADGGARMHFYCADAAGHAVIEVKLRGDACRAHGEMQSVALRIPIQAAGVDEFIKQLRGVGKTLGASAHLPKAAS